MYYKIQWLNSFNNFYFDLLERDEPARNMGGEVIKNGNYLGWSNSLQFGLSTPPNWFIEGQKIGIDTIKEKVLGKLAPPPNVAPANMQRSYNNDYFHSVFDIDFIETIQDPFLKLVVCLLMKRNIENIALIHGNVMNEQKQKITEIFSNLEKFHYTF